MGKAIILNEDIIREVLRLNDDNNDLNFTCQELHNTLTQMGYPVEGHEKAITKSGFIKPWQFLVTQLGIRFSKKKIVNFNEISYKLMEPVNAVVQEVPYNLSHYLMSDFVSNLWSNGSFLFYPCFLMRVITHQLDF
ncbi:putative EF-hand domain-containing protein [Helianthus anomalus]